MRLILNVIWFVLAGLWMAIAYAIAALIMFILIITIPFGVAALRIGIFALLCLTIIGIPLALANFKLIPVTFRPFGRDIVSIEEAERQGLPQQVTIPATARRA
jgi:uncharacterized membrane protein YccF (DUF307 family)